MAADLSMGGAWAMTLGPSHAKGVQGMSDVGSALGFVQDQPLGHLQAVCVFFAQVE